MSEFQTKSPITIRELNEQYMNSFYQDNVVSDYSVLKIAIDESLSPDVVERLTALYRPHIEKHNADLSTSEYRNAGFDLFVANTTTFDGKDKATKFVNLGIKCEMIYCKKSVAKYIESVRSNGDTEDEIGLSYHTGYYLYPRSSMSKTPLMLANHVGIIDSGYRGNMIAALRSLSKEEYVLEEGTRLFQIVSPTMCPVYVVLVPESELTTTERGAGGFGSTGGEPKSQRDLFPPLYPPTK